MDQDVDIDPNAIVVYQDTMFRDPGISLTDIVIQTVRRGSFQFDTCDPPLGMSRGVGGVGPTENLTERRTPTPMVPPTRTVVFSGMYILLMLGPWIRM